jgi:hypothetical protein
MPCMVGVVFHSFKSIAFLESFFGMLDSVRPVAQQVVGARSVLEDIGIARREDQRSVKMTQGILGELNPRFTLLGEFTIGYNF